MAINALTRFLFSFNCYIFHYDISFLYFTFSFFLNGSWCVLISKPVFVFLIKDVFVQSLVKHSELQFDLFERCCIDKV